MKHEVAPAKVNVGSNDDLVAVAMNTRGASVDGRETRENDVWCFLLLARLNEGASNSTEGFQDGQESGTTHFAGFDEETVALFSALRHGGKTRSIRWPPVRVGWASTVTRFHPQPVFPRELEREIFEICALSRPVLVPKLILVARRVKTWIEPILYLRLHLACHPLMATPESRRELFRQSVRNMYLSDAVDDNSFLFAFPRLENLRTRVSTHDQDSAKFFAENLPRTLKHLYIQDPAPRFPLAALSQLTHLDVMGDRDLGQDISVFYDAVVQLPRLTHISFSNSEYEPLYIRLLKNCLSLEVLFYLKSHDEPLVDQDDLTNDIRYVCGEDDAIYDWDWVEDWQMGVQYGRDYWARIERFIAKRRSKEINVLTRSLLSSTIRRKSTEFVRDSVRNIFEQFCGPFLVQILKVCPEVENLGSRLPGLKKLSIKDPVVLTPTPAYSHITDLHMSSNPGSESDTDDFYASIVQCLPSLTHLSLSNYGYRPILLPLLQNCPLLKVLVYFTYERDFAESLAEDVRFVVYGDPDSYHRFNDWRRGVCFGDDRWYYAERLIEKRIPEHAAGK
ncbi:hypothetical protein FB45DRAFT_1094229 [Roridomyces roridus]|uniref:Uncharacterized protein n=1 Tax=Roridomyces roridus TaxID=1738132 RepID=A0AAD7BGF2_9AGAR|nr:hypothetical protein FB45DRAFT_1094229 [Roridomyces roridus]